MFPDKDRLIFRYAVRGVEHFADPLAVRRALLRASAGEYDQLDRDSRDRPEVPDGKGGFVDQGPEDAGAVLSREDAKEKLHVVACAAFGLTPFDGKTGLGVTEAESSTTLDAFLVWLEGNGRPGANSAGSSAPTASPLASGPTTSPTSGSC